jgi:hypothetical protein
MAEHSMTRTLLALCVLAAATSGAFAQASKSSTSSEWNQAVDLKPLVPVLPRVFIPPDSQLNAGGVGGGSQVSTPMFDPNANSTPAPGLRLTIPTR